MMTTCLIGVFDGRSSRSAAMLGSVKPPARIVLAPSAASLLCQDELCLAFIVFPLRMCGGPSDVPRPSRRSGRAPANLVGSHDRFFAEMFRFAGFAVAVMKLKRYP